MPVPSARRITALVNQGVLFASNEFMTRFMRGTIRPVVVHFYISYLSSWGLLSIPLISQEKIFGYENC